MPSEPTLNGLILELLPYSCSPQGQGFLKLSLSDGTTLYLRNDGYSSVRLSSVTNGVLTSQRNYSWPSPTSQEIEIHSISLTPPPATPGRAQRKRPALSR